MAHYFYIFINNKRNIVSTVSNIGYYNNVRVYKLKSDNIITLLDTKQKNSNACSEGDALLIDSSGEVTIYKYLFVEGKILSENIVMSSDRRLKTNIRDISGIDNIRKLQPKQYIKYNKKEIGFIVNDI